MAPSFLLLFITTLLVSDVLCNPSSRFHTRVKRFGDTSKASIIKNFQDQIKSLFQGSNKILEVVMQPECGPIEVYDCVAYILCDENGRIITDGGTLLIDRKISPLPSCTIPKTPEVLAQCCLVPGAEAPPSNSPNCQEHEVCVDSDMCTPEGIVTTGSTGLIDVRIMHEGCDQPARTCCTPPEPPSNICGIRNLPLDNNIPSTDANNHADFGEFPWQGILSSLNENNLYEYKCGCILISDRFVLTAAHCIEDIKSADDLILRFGEWQVNTHNDPPLHEDVKVVEAFTHPEYRTTSNHNGIALLKLATPLKMKYNINVICLPDVDEIIIDGQESISSGWGRHSFEGELQQKLKKIIFPYIEHSRCQSLLRKTILSKYFILNNSFICAGGLADKDTCSGDGGGPLIIKRQSSTQYFLAGITSWGIECGTKDVPGVYIDVRIFRDWIDRLMSENSP